MFQQEKEYLEDAYSYYQKTGERSMQYEFSKDNREKQLTIRCCCSVQFITRRSD